MGIDYLAGVLNKFGYTNGKIELIKRGLPTIQILKPEIAQYEDTVYNEFFCMRLAKAIGIDAPNVTIYPIDRKPYYLIVRYAREANEDGSIARIHHKSTKLDLAPAYDFEIQQSIQI